MECLMLEDQSVSVVKGLMGSSSGDAFATSSSPRLDTMRVSHCNNHSNPSTPSRKGVVSLNHLLNFQLPPRQKNPFSSPPRKTKQYFQPYRKERFIQANFRFIVKEKKDYSIHMVDPDSHLPWSDIVQIVVPTFEEPTCPICLNHPTVPRFTKCGHIYCFSCILRHLSLGDKSDRHTCPICFEMISSKDLKSVRFHFTSDWNKLLQKTVEFRLMQRSNSCTVAFPKSGFSCMGGNLPLSIDTPDALTFCKITVASDEYVQRNIILSEVQLITKELEDCKSSGEMETVPFLEMAMRMIQERMNLSASNGGTNSAQNSPVCLGNQGKTFSSESLERFELDQSNGHGNNIGNTNNTKDYSSDDDLVFLMPDDMAPSRKNSSAGKKNIPSGSNSGACSNGVGCSGTGSSADGFYFYQAQDGQHIYLHPLDIKILKHEFGSYGKFPETLSVSLLEMDESTFTEDMRKRCKYLSHLPLSCDVAFCAIDLRGVVSPETLAVFNQELRQRTARRVGKLKKEERAASRRTSVPDSNGIDILAMSSNYSETSPVLALPLSYPPKNQHFVQTFREEDFPFPLGSPSSSKPVVAGAGGKANKNEPVAFISGFPSLADSCNNNNEYSSKVSSSGLGSPKGGSSGISFARVLATSPGTGSSDNNNSAGGVWGLGPATSFPAVLSTIGVSPVIGGSKAENNQSVDPFPSVAAINSTNDTLTSSPSNTIDINNNNNITQSGKKNGKKKIVLMSTNSTRRY